MQREETLQHSGRERQANCESASPPLSLQPLPSTSTLPFSSLSALKQLPPLMQGTFQITAGGGREGGRSTGGVMQEEQGVRAEKGGYNDHSKAAGGGHSSQGEDASPPPPPSFSSSKNPGCYTLERRRLTARHSNLCNRTVF